MLGIVKNIGVHHDSEDSEMGKALKEMQKRNPFLGQPSHGLYAIVKDLASACAGYWSRQSRAGENS